MKVVISETLWKPSLGARCVRVAKPIGIVMARGRPETKDIRSLRVALTGAAEPVGRQWPSPGFLDVSS